MVKLLIMRHGETALNKEERLRSHIDTPLNEVGIQEAQEASQTLKDMPITRIYHSPLDRADHTADIVAKPHDIKPIPREWFSPLDYGSLAGKKISEIQPQLDELNKTWQTNPNHEVEGGESWNEFQDRTLGGLHSILRAADDGDTLLVVCHLRNALLINAVAKIGHPLEGKEIMLMAGKEFYQKSGAVAEYSWDGSMKYVDMIFEPKESGNKGKQS